jgi:prevent-host-death family protein
MTRIAATKAREEFSETLNRVAYGQERIILERRGKGIAAVISIEDLELLEALEEQADVEMARKRLAEEDSIPYEEARKELGLA